VVEATTVGPQKGDSSKVYRQGKNRWDGAGEAKGKAAGCSLVPHALPCLAVSVRRPRANEWQLSRATQCSGPLLAAICGDAPGGRRNVVNCRAPRGMLDTLDQRGTGTGSRPSPSGPSTVCSTPSIRCRRGLHAALAQGAGSGAEGLGIQCLSRRRFAAASVPCRHALAARTAAPSGLACEPALFALRDSS
jgi:hypothetical protein